MGQEIGKTSNTGKMGRRLRRDALHFAILYSARPEWSHTGTFVAPKDGYWMDPNAFYRRDPPYDSQSLVSLPDDHSITGDLTIAVEFDGPLAFPCGIDLRDPHLLTPAQPKPNNQN